MFMGLSVSWFHKKFVVIRYAKNTYNTIYKFANFQSIVIATFQCFEIFPNEYFIANIFQGRKQYKKWN